MKTVSFQRSLVAISAVLSLLFGTEAVNADAAPAVPTGRVQTFRIGSYNAVALRDGEIQEPNDGKSFVLGQPITKVAAILKAAGAPGDHFELSIQPLLVNADKRVLLFDTGAGNYFGPMAGTLPQSMTTAGVSPAGVTDIFISHAHGDHVGGLITPAGKPAFPNAAIHMSAPEWQFLSGMKPEDAKNVGISDITALVAVVRPKVVPFQPGAELIPGVVKAVEIKGHTPGHSGYEIGSGKDSVLYIGDSMHSYVTSVQRAAWKVAFDTDQATAAASRVALEKRAAASGQRIYAVHFPFPGIGKIVEEKGGFVWVPESVH
jgi:glyoxylase-like metal-dependent hydrolase (beta-lactamase superfamily II)